MGLNTTAHDLDKLSQDLNQVFFEIQIELVKNSKPNSVA